ncbi:hypothetical protein ROHU_025089 [Labeo rohita]|uniref:Uncharacterized protein n=1 Tax=Labeo rohita TaxID=84645 RepID=A0A498MJ68_LABRO|nr:hypothetical protein ROHU_025089 [Labeo rohita]
MEQSVVTGSRDLGTATATTIVGGARVPKDWAKSVRLTKGEPVGRGHFFEHDLYFLQLRVCNSDTGVFADCFITGSVKGKKN